MAEPSYEVYRPTAHPVPEGSAPADRHQYGHSHRSVGWCSGGSAQGRWLKVSVICVAIWMLTGGGYFWPMWVILGLGIPVLMRRR